MQPTITIHLDWVRYSAPWIDTLTELENLSRVRWEGELFQFTGETIDIGQGYNRGLRMLAGAVFWHSDRPEQGIGVQLSGEDLADMRRVGLDEIELLHFITSIGGHCTTVHACINVHDAGADVADLIAEHAAGQLRTSARNIGVYSSKTKVKGKWQTGDTVYVGSAKSERQIRVYNKAAERGIDGDWVRLEIVWRGPYAKAAHAAMERDGVAPVVRTAIGDQLGSSASWYALAISGEVAPAFVIPRKESARLRWLKSVVAPALRSEIAAEKERGEDSLYLLFYQLLDDAHPLGKD